MARNQVAPSCSKTWPLGAQALQGAVDRSAVAAVAEVLLGVPAVEGHAELGEVVADVGEHVRESRVEHGAEPVAEQRPGTRDHRVHVLVLVAARAFVRRQAGEHLRRGAPQRVAVPLAQPRCDRADVFTAIAVRRERQGLAAQLQVAQPGAGREDVHLPARVVHVVLAVHAPAVGGQQVGDRRAVGGMPAVADVQRPGRVRRDELDDGPAAGAAVAATVLLAFGEHAFHLGLPGGGRQEEIDEAGSRDLGLRDQRVPRDRCDDLRRQRARVGARGLGEAHRDAGREVAVLGVARAFDGGVRRRAVAERACGQCGERFVDQFFDEVFQGAPVSGIAAC